MFGEHPAHPGADLLVPFRQEEQDLLSGERLQDLDGPVRRTSPSRMRSARRFETSCFAAVKLACPGSAQE